MRWYMFHTHPSSTVQGNYIYMLNFDKKIENQELHA
jgi:hypothetical protein